MQVEMMYGLPVYDPAYRPFEGPAPDAGEARKRIGALILSASGWRGVCAASGNPEDAGGAIAPIDAWLTALAAKVFACWLRKEGKRTVLVGIDARPTGVAMASCAIQAFLSQGIGARYLFIASAPEIMAENFRGASGCDAFFYISASHNPVGHNGIKFGGDGGVYPASITGPLAEAFRAQAQDQEAWNRFREELASVDTAALAKVYAGVPAMKKESLAAYRAFVLETAGSSADDLRALIAAHPLGLVVDFNGSARAASIDRSFLTEAGIRLRTLHDKPREIAHGIVPEGANLDECRAALEEAHAEDPCFVLGYVPDNDGDRGNLVIWDETEGRAVVPEAQEVFALVAMAVLSEQRLHHPSAPLAIAVNGPTSLRIDRIAEALGAGVFRSEVGEANVVQLAEKLRKQGYLVPLCGEGSNGGTIAHPSKVRDPMDTVLSLLKLESDPRILALWCGASGRKLPKRPTLGSALHLLPVYTTTGAFSSDGTMHVVHEAGELKDRYEALFRTAYASIRPDLEAAGWTGCTIWQMEGTSCTQGMGREKRHAPYKGGWKAAFTDAGGTARAFVWMRPSGTEPIFRVLCDVEGDRQDLHDRLLSWHRNLVRTADQS